MSIFPLLKNIERRGENVTLDHYLEIRDGEKITGARGVVHSFMDWCDPEEPSFFYEFAHLEKPDGAVEEFVRELHIDDVVMRVFAPLDTKPSAQEKGSEQARALIAGMIERSIGDPDKRDFTPEDRPNLRYRCIVEGRNFEIWKIGFHDGPYQILLAAPNFIGKLNMTTIIEIYVSGAQRDKEFTGFEPMPAETLEKTRLIGYGGEWYNKGIVDLDSQLTARLQEEAGIRARQELADRVYSAALAHNFGEIDMNVLPQVITNYTPLQIALMSVAGMDTEQHASQFGRAFVKVCQGYCPKGLQEANNILKQVARRAK